MDIPLKTVHFYCLLLLSSYLFSPAVKFPTGSLIVGVPQQNLETSHFLVPIYFIHTSQKDYINKSV